MTFHQSRRTIELRKVYRVIPDDVAAARGFIRVIDESGEDYLYPEGSFVPIDLPESARITFANAS